MSWVQTNLQCKGGGHNVLGTNEFTVQGGAQCLGYERIYSARGGAQCLGYERIYSARGGTMSWVRTNLQCKGGGHNVLGANEFTGQGRGAG